MNPEVPEGLFHCAECGETYLGDDCPVCERSELSIPWVLTAHGWRQPRLDGTVWAQDPSDASAEVPVSVASYPSSALHRCPDGERLRIAEDLPCPVCSDTPSQAAEQQPIPTASQSNAGKRSKSRNKFATVAWVIAGLIAAVVAANAIDSEYDLGIFDQPAVAAGGSVSTTMASSTTTTTRPPTTTTRATTTTAPPTTTPNFVGWFEDSCVAFDGDFVEPVSCDGLYDAVIIAVASVEDNCPMATDWVVELEPRVACLDEDSLASTTGVFPPGIASLEQGSPTWAVVLASGSSMEDAHLQQVVDTAEKAGYLTGPTDCDFGATEALEAPSGHFTVSVYFSNESDAVEARESFASLGLVGAVAEVETYCLD